MPGADWIGHRRVGRVGSPWLGRGLEPACAGKGPSRAAAPARFLLPSRACVGARCRVTSCPVAPYSSLLGVPQEKRVNISDAEPPAGLTGAEWPWAQL